MPWLQSSVAAQQQAANQQTPYGSSTNQYILNNNQDNYLPLSNFHQSPAAHASFQPQYWSAMPPAMMFPAPPPQPMLAQQSGLSNEQQSPQSKANSNNNRPLTPSNSGDILSTSQPNQPQFMNMPRTAQTPGRGAHRAEMLPFCLALLVNFPYYATASPTFLDPNLLMQTSRPPNGSPGIRMYQQQVPIPSTTLLELIVTLANMFSLFQLTRATRVVSTAVQSPARSRAHSTVREMTNATFPDVGLLSRCVHYSKPAPRRIHRRLLAFPWRSSSVQTRSTAADADLSRANQRPSALAGVQQHDAVDDATADVEHRCVRRHVQHAILSTERTISWRIAAADAQR